MSLSDGSDVYQQSFRAEVQQRRWLHVHIVAWPQLASPMAKPSDFHRTSYLVGGWATPLKNISQLG